MSKGAGRWAALVATSFLVHGALTINSTETALWNAQGQQGSLLVQQLADAAAPLAMGRDMVSLSVLTARYENHPGIASIRIFNPLNERLAEAGLTNDQGRLFSAPLQLQQQRLGEVDLRLIAPGKADIVRASLGNMGLSALLHFLLLIGGLSMSPRKAVAARRATGISPPATAAPVAAAEAEPRAIAPASIPVEGSHLHIALEDPNGLLQRVNAEMADEMLSLFDQLIDRAARVYGGEVATPFDSSGVTVHFLNNEAQDRPLRALAAAQLFLQMITDIDEERRAYGRFSLPCKAGIVHDQTDAYLATTLARTAPANRILTTLPSPEQHLPCRLGNPYRLAIDDSTAIQIALVESFAAEYQHLISNQSSHILTPAESV